jgi:hypothetical protein
VLTEVADKNYFLLFRANEVGVFFLQKDFIIFVTLKQHDLTEDNGLHLYLVTLQVCLLLG